MKNESIDGIGSFKCLTQRILFAGLLVLATVSCKQEVEKQEIIRPVKTIEVGNVQDLSNRTFPGITEEEHSVDLAFRVGGPLIKLNAIEGQHLKKWQLIAEVDSRDFEIDLMAKEARFIQARAEEERFKLTFERGSISKSEYDQKLALYLEAKSALMAAKNNLFDTKLRAPFESYIDQKLVENYERIHVGQTIVTLFDLSALEVRFNISEALAVYFRDFEDFDVSIDIYGDAIFKADLKEIGKKSDRSAGIPVILELRHKNTPDSEFRIIPGVACRVKVNLKVDTEIETAATEFTIPSSAIYAQPDSEKKYVFILNPESMEVKKTEVELGALVSNNFIWVINGLNRGDILITAGTKVLQDGQKVQALNN